MRSNWFLIDRRRFCFFIVLDRNGSSSSTMIFFEIWRIFSSPFVTEKKLGKWPNDFFLFCSFQVIETFHESRQEASSNFMAHALIRSSSQILLNTILALKTSLSNANRRPEMVRWIEWKFSLNFVFFSRLLENGSMKVKFHSIGWGISGFTAMSKFEQRRSRSLQF